MRIVLTSDLHYDVRRSQAPTEHIAREIVRIGGDVLVLVGDSASTDLAILERVLGLFDDWKGPRLFVAGNHELWVPPDGDSLHRLNHELPALARRCGAVYLEESPFLAGDVAIVGGVGWYDYTFRSSALGVPLRFYQHKISPGLARLDERYHHLVDGYHDLAPGLDDMIVRWMDGQRARLDRSDVELTRLLLERLRAHLSDAAGRAERVLVALHHVPFHALVPRSVSLSFAFAEAFMGSELFGELILEFPQVRQVFCGHAHRRKIVQLGRVTATCIGSTYTEKLYDVVDL